MQKQVWVSFQLQSLMPNAVLACREATILRRESDMRTAQAVWLGAPALGALARQHGASPCQDTLAQVVHDCSQGVCPHQVQSGELSSRHRRSHLPAEVTDTVLLRENRGFHVSKFQGSFALPFWPWRSPQAYGVSQSLGLFECVNIHMNHFPPGWPEEHNYWL